MSLTTDINPITQQMITSIVQSLYVPAILIPENESPTLTLGKPSATVRKGIRGRPSHYLQGKKWCKSCEKYFESPTIKCPSCGRSARTVPHNKKYFRNQRKVFEGY
jgi:hypothetical protein